MHAALMIFLFMIPSFAGLANFVIPLMLGADDMAFPRLNALSFWMLPTAGVMMVASLFWQGFGAGWTAYAPLASDYQTVSQLFFNIGVQFAGTSSILTAVNFIVTILTMRAPGMTLWRMPLLVWANLTTSALVVLGTPFVAGSQFMLLFDHDHAHRLLQLPGRSGAVLLYQHIFWFYSHPAVYIMMLPGFGIVCEVIPVIARKPIFGYRPIAFSTISIGVLGFSVWAHHMFVSGMPPWLRIPMMITTMLIAVPTGIKVFSWVGTLWDGVIDLQDADAVGARLPLHVRARRPLRRLAGDRAARHPRLRHVLHGGAHPLRAVRRIGVHDLRRAVLLVPEDDRADVQRDARQAALLGRRSSRSTPPSSRCTTSAPRACSAASRDYEPKYANWNMFITICAFLLGASTFIFVYNAIVSWIRGEPAPANPWRSLTLEWQVSSPPPVFNFDSQPRIVGGPYNYGQPGARHAVFDETAPQPAALRIL